MHGGITFSRGNADYPLRENSDNLWWFGFDCAHAGDAFKYEETEGCIFRDEEYVEAEIESLAQQLKDYEESMKEE